jgi:hypothetical protein
MQTDLRRWVAVCEAETARPDMSEAGRRLHDAGYERISNESTYGEVFRKPGDPYVLKLFNRNDKAFPAFVAYALDNPSPHLPAFRSKIIKVTDDYAAIRMEYLPPLPTAKAGRLSDALEGCVLAWINGPPIWPWVKKAMSQLEKTQPTLLRTTKDLTDKLLINRGFFSDLKPEHFRQRGSTIVLIDPICGRGHESINI